MGSSPSSLFCKRLSEILARTAGLSSTHALSLLRPVLAITGLGPGFGPQSTKMMLKASLCHYTSCCLAFAPFQRMCVQSPPINGNHRMLGMGGTHGHSGSQSTSWVSHPELPHVTTAVPKGEPLFFSLLPCLVACKAEARLSQPVLSVADQRCRIF